MQMFTAIRGKGAFLNGNPIKGVSSVVYLLIDCCLFKCYAYALKFHSIVTN